MLKYIVYYFYRILVALWRVEVIVHPETQKRIDAKLPTILAHWHGDELAVLHLVSLFKLATMTSTSKDGQLIDFVITKLGGSTTKGSSTRGGISALKGLIRLCREGRVISMAVDGPRGPIHQPKPGVFELSRLCSAHIVPVGVFASNAFVFEKSWNKAFLPLPLSKVKIIFGAPIPAIQPDQNPKEFKHATMLAEVLFGARQQAANYIAGVNTRC